MIQVTINDKDINLKEGEKIAFTKQVNPLGDLSTRECNFTNSFKAPKTPQNIATFRGLGIVGSNSNIPYQKNKARLINEGIALIVKGWAIPEETNEYFDTHIYDGIIDFFKLMDNIKFEDIDLSELDHQKDTAAVKDNWENGNAAYKYLLADYNGITHFDNAGTNTINTDYLLPSVNVAWLWQRIFDTFGWTYSGAVFATEKFLNSYITFPKGQVSAAIGELIGDIDWTNNAGFWQIDIQNPAMIEILGTITATETSYHQLAFNGDVMCALGVFGTNNSILAYGINTGLNPSIDDIGSTLIHVATSNKNDVDEDDNPDPTEFNDSFPIPLEAGDVLRFYYFRDGSPIYTYSQYNNQTDEWDTFHEVREETVINLDVQLNLIDQAQINQTSFFKDLSVKEFFKEVLWKFSLTPFPDKINSEIEFLTLDERINGDVEDWSDRFVDLLSESYTYGSYAKLNWFRFRYNEEGEDFNDGKLEVFNENLEDHKNVIVSKTYSPNELPVFFNVSGTSRIVPKVELWQKELKDNNGVAEIEYKSRDARFVFLRESVLVTAANIGSQVLNEYASVTQVRLAENYDYSWQKIVNEDYAPINDILRKTKAVKAIFRLSASQFDKFNMKPRIHVKQLGGDFIVDKIIKKDVSGPIAEAELIKINR